MPGMVSLWVGLGLVLAAPVSAGIDWHRTEIDLGRVYRDEPQRMSFGFVNSSDDTVFIYSSDDTVFIYDIEPSCDCTNAQAVPPAVPPHNSGEILVFFDPMGYEGKGRVTEYVRLATSDPENPEAELRFSIEVGVGPEPSPRALNFGNVCKGDSDTLDLVVRPGPEGGLRILGAESGSDCVKVEHVGRRKDGVQEFRVTVCNLDCRGPMSTHVEIATADSMREVIRVPVTANLLGDVVIEPAVIAFGPTLPGNRVEVPVRVYSTAGFKFGIKKVTCTANSVECTVTRAEDSGYEIGISIKEDAPAGRVSGQLILETDCGSQPLVTAEITGYVRSRR